MAYGSAQKGKFVQLAIRATLAASLIAGAASAASAQSLNAALNPAEGETRIVAAITVPLGHSHGNTSTAPRVELISRSRVPDGILPVVIRDEERRWQERRIGFTLDGSDQVMINGRAIQLGGSEDRDGISTLGAVGIGLGVVLAVSIVTFADGVDAIEDLTDPD